MAATTKGRILVVEDMPDISDSYRYHLERAGYTVEVVERKTDAIEAIRCKRFDVALVDLQLKDDITHKGGIDVLDKINDLQDGTVAIVVSATHDIKESIASYRRGISDFIMKGDIRSADLVKPIEKALRARVQSRFGDFPSLSAYLAAPEVTPIWESRVQETLGCTYASLQKILWTSLRPYLPVIRRKDGSGSLALDKGRGALGGLFWSKEVGRAVWFSACGKGVLIEPADTDAVRLTDHEGKNVLAAVWTVTAGRDEFLERVGDRPGASK